MLRSGSMFSRSRRAWLAGVALFAAGCLSPTLPLPPPSDPTVSSTDTQGLIRLTGTVQPQSEVFALNHNSNQIAGQYTESGNYTFTIEALPGEYLSLWYVHQLIESPSQDFVVKVQPAPAP